MRIFLQYNKKLLFPVVCLLIGVFSISCEKEEITFKGPYHVRFTDTTITVKESISENVKISIHNAGPILQEDITIYYSISGSARENVDYSIEGTKGEVVIPAGESFGYIDLNIINNANNILESQDIIFTLNRVSSDKLQVGRSTNGIIGKSFTLIIEDDCILSGTYKAFPPDSLADLLPEISNIKVSSTNCNEYTLSNWDIYVTSYFPPDRNLTFIDNGDNSITIPEQEEETFAEEVATMKGTGSIDPTTKRITLNIEFPDFEDEPVVMITFYPQ